MLEYVILIASHLKWACNYLLYHSLIVSKSFLQQNYFMPEYYHAIIGEEVSKVEQYYMKRREGSEEDVECSVCLCKIEEGEEMRELRCDHLFHRECLDRWVGYNHKTCPLCRGSLFSSSTTVTDQLGVEVLLFKYCSFGSGDRETWWLR
ncbi:hypothetical protein I3843_06G091800 [Carya illinoinensis]|uniref:RING-type domain-containing protein n=1 Tax=Carya illinoinensis TaxID=32201 RepID=A0A8T1QA65_CARIL|nr:hypothetical protein I3760_06G098600 [Carya illinoinensis]KAG6651255.1 hypothetical protein CIPAW_06G097800 [Carya illinoinensis]KAG6708764.1 hypothetical protein I3842_06G098300 [Carya illinoinensis]KAG7975298.1 hypothetical protein I3843_06G091800 [Carya illinoinensis]